MEIYFARHGESEANRLGVISNRVYGHGLTGTGKRQAAALAGKLAGRDITRICTSPLLRAVQTAEILAARLGLPFELADALREFDCGIIEGKSDPGSWQLHSALWRAWTVHGHWESRIEGGESYLDIQARFVPFIEHLLSRYGDSPERIVLVGHGGTYRCMLPLVLQNIDLDDSAEHPLACTSLVISVAAPEGLVCRQWAGVIPEAGTIA